MDERDNRSVNFSLCLRRRVLDGGSLDELESSCVSKIIRLVVRGNFFYPSRDTSQVALREVFLSQRIPQFVHFSFCSLKHLADDVSTVFLHLPPNLQRLICVGRLGNQDVQCEVPGRRAEFCVENYRDGWPFPCGIQMRTQIKSASGVQEIALH